MSENLELRKIESLEGSVFTHYLLASRNVPLVYLKCREEALGSPVVLEEIETRDIFRGYGYASTALKMLAEIYGLEKVPHYGEFSTEGFAYLSKHLDRNGAGDPKVIRNFESMSFVRDWSALVDN